MNEKYELVKFEQDGLTLDVNVSPSEDTVWLTQDAMALLFGRNQGVISRHINNIFKEGELDKNTSMQKMHKSRNNNNPNYRPPVYYNLDVVISVGYRVKSRNGVIFRRWANSVLKEYLLKGYVLNQDRTLITNDNYIELVHRVNNIDKRLSKLESDNHIDNEKIFFDGEWFDGRSFIKDIFTRAKEEIILIDPYADIKALDYLKVKTEGVIVKLFISSKAKLTQGDIDAFNEQYGNLEVILDDNFHDRFVIVDRAILYHLGASLNYIGKKVFAITKIEDENLLVSMKERLGA
ncbi:MAG: virulence RhuM family protein [Bacilli bacterium]|nr:virulence RhuM family protein [Bacilli bacterium]